MSKKTLSREIEKELEKLNDTIDRKIIQGKSYAAEAKRHRTLSATLRRMHAEEEGEPVVSRRIYRPFRSPARRRLERGVFARMFGFGVAM